MDMSILYKGKPQNEWIYTEHSLKNCDRCDRSTRPVCPVCKHTLSAKVKTQKDFVHGITVCEVCRSVIEVELSGIV